MTDALDWSYFYSKKAAPAPAPTAKTASGHERAANTFAPDNRPVNFAKMSPIDRRAWDLALAKAQGAGSAQSAQQTHAAGKPSNWDLLSSIGKRESDLMRRG